MNMATLVKALSVNVGPIPEDTTLLEAPLLFQKPVHTGHVMPAFFMPEEPLRITTLELSETEIIGRMEANAGFTGWMHDIHAPKHMSKAANSGGCEVCKMAERMLARNSKSQLGLQLLTEAHRNSFVNHQRAVEKLMELVDSFSEYTNSILFRG